MFLSLLAVLGIYDPDGQFWAIIAVTIVLLWFTPNIMTAYFSEALLGCTGTLYALTYAEEGNSLSPLIHLSCIVLFTLNCSVRGFRK